ncbi:MAG: TonB-dependent receptor [Pseudomonadales bacterium]|jgi:iron complex outermembrane receptor protein
MSATFSKKRTLLATAVAAVIGLPGLAQAQVMEEVVVTAQKREQNLQDVGVSVSAFTGEQTKALGWDSSEDIAAQTPGLIATSFSGDSSVSIFTLRGVGQNDFADHQEAPSAMYVDGVYISATGAAGAQMFDVNRVEVLRGPQGTLFGRNATGGLVHIINNKPTEEFEAYINATVASYNQRRVEMAVSGGITDSVMGRFSLLKDDADGYFDNLSGEDARNRDLLSMRGQLAIEFAEDIQLDLSAWSNVVDRNVAGAYDFRPAYKEVGDIDTDWQGTPDESPAPNQGFQNPTGVIDKDAKGYTATLSIDFESMTFTSITDYQNLEKYYLEDSDGNSDRTLEYWSDQDTSQFSQELRLNGSNDKLSWTTGLYFLNIDGEYASNIDMPTFGGATTNDFTLETTSWSAFGQVEYSLTDALALTVGGRYVVDEKDFVLDSYCTPSALGAPGAVMPPWGAINDCSGFTSGDPNNPIVAEIPNPVALDRSDSDFSGKVQLDYRLSDDTLLYAGISRGMKGGGFTAPLDGFLPVSELSFEPEILTSYEAGFKSRLFDGAGRLNASIFSYDYSDYQAFVFQGLTSVVKNHDASITGGEIEFYVSPAEGWDVSLGTAFLDARVHDVELTPGGGNFADQDMITAPDLTANWLVRKSFTMNNGELAFQVDGSYTGEQQFNTTNSALTHADAYTLWNARASYVRESGSNSWEVAAFAKNFGNEEYLTYAFDLGEFFGYTLQVYGPPRWVGVELQYSFN